MIYAWEGFKKMCCRKTISVNKFIKSFSVIKVSDDFNMLNTVNLTKKEDEQQREEIFNNDVESTEESNFLSRNSHRSQRESSYFSRPKHKQLHGRG